MQENLEAAGNGGEEAAAAAAEKMAGEEVQEEEEEEEAELRHLEEDVKSLADRVSAFREKGLEYFTVRAAGLDPGKRMRRDSSSNDGQKTTQVVGDEENLTAEERQEEEKWTSEMQALKDRLVVANEALPPLLKEIESWKEKIEEATKMMQQKDISHFGFASDEDTLIP